MYPSSANATTPGTNAVVEVVWGPPCGIVTHTGLWPLVEAFLDWMRSDSVGARVVMGMMDGVRSLRASLTAEDNSGLSRTFHSRVSY